MHSAQDWAARAANCRAGQATDPGRAAVVDAGFEFMASLLAGYEPSGPDETYETDVLRSERHGQAADDARQVDVYEMYWADLSRLQQAWVRIFSGSISSSSIWAALGCMRFAPRGRGRPR